MVCATTAGDSEGRSIQPGSTTHAGCPADPQLPRGFPAVALAAGVELADLELPAWLRCPRCWRFSARANATTNTSTTEIAAQLRPICTRGSLRERIMICYSSPHEGVGAPCH